MRFYDRVALLKNIFYACKLNGKYLKIIYSDRESIRLLYKNIKF